MHQIPIVQSENDFDDPLHLLGEDHRRTVGFLEQVLRVAQCGRGGAMNAAQRHVLDGALRYFRQATPLTVADEEKSLFPLVRQRAGDGDARAQQCLPLMDHLEADHRRALDRHAVIENIASRWLDENALPEADLEMLDHELTALRALYAGHVAIEDHQLIALANQVLPADSVAALGREMAARRGLDFSAPRVDEG